MVVNLCGDQIYVDFVRFFICEDIYMHGINFKVSLTLSRLSFPQAFTVVRKTRHIK